VSSDVPSQGTILVVDDEEVVSRLLVTFLRHVGFTVLQASSAGQALALVHNRQPPIDLALIDIDMPGMDGIELASWVVTECPSPQTMLMGSPAGEPIEVAVVQGCSLPVLRKPLDLDRLLELLRVMVPPLPPIEDCDTDLPYRWSTLAN
jgi:CheY-like chemotaxis protein